MLDADIPKPAATKLFTKYLNANQSVGLYQCYNQHHYLTDFDPSPVVPCPDCDDSSRIQACLGR